MLTIYEIRQPSEDWGPPRATLDNAMESYEDKLAQITGRLRQRTSLRDEWRELNHAEASRQAREALQKGGDGQRVITTGTKPGAAVWVIRRSVEPEGGVVVRAALTQLGVDYVWAASNPEGPAGGPGAGFDCSGFTAWCYRQADVWLPHSAEAQRTYGEVIQFGDRRKLIDGDLVFYDAGPRLQPGQADHCGIVADKGHGVIDASSGEDKVVHRDIDSNPVLVFGRVEAVNGPPK